MIDRKQIIRKIGELESEYLVQIDGEIWRMLMPPEDRQWASLLQCSKGWWALLMVIREGLEVGSRQCPPDKRSDGRDCEPPKASHPALSSRM